jgi:hypothetical protein
MRYDSRTMTTTPSPRAAVSTSLPLWGGIAFSFAFSALIYFLSVRLESVPHAPDTGAADYYWKLIDPTLVTRLSVWGLYVAHQLAIWWTIWYAQTRVKTYSGELRSVNVWALGINAAFIALHLVQTHVFYDGLAQDVSIFSSQGSVIVLLVLVLIMENKRRGMFFGKKVPLSAEVVDFLRHYHGYFFAWATIYTFWYHPMEATWGHLIGFVYTSFLMLQGALMLTRAHVNKYWTLALEVMVLFHGTMVAVLQGNGLWPMFFFGFGGIFVITQMYGVPLGKWTRGLILAAYCGAVVFVYRGRGWGKLNEIIRIPAIDYILVFGFTGLIWLGLWVAKKINPKLRFTRGAAPEVAAD